MVDKPEVYISAGWEKFDQDGRLIHAGTREQIQALVEALVGTIREQEYALAS